MLLDVPASLDGLLSLFRSCFSQPTFQTFRALLLRIRQALARELRVS